jgi:predicted nuclease with TOPRIM domain
LKPLRSYETLKRIHGYETPTETPIELRLQLAESTTRNADAAARLAALQEAAEKDNKEKKQLAQQLADLREQAQAYQDRSDILSTEKAELEEEAAAAAAADVQVSQ